MVHVNNETEFIEANVGTEWYCKIDGFREVRPYTIIGGQELRKKIRRALFKNGDDNAQIYARRVKVTFAHVITSQYRTAFCLFNNNYLCGYQFSGARVPAVPNNN